MPRMTFASSWMPKKMTRPVTGWNWKWRWLGAVAQALLARKVIPVRKVRLVRPGLKDHKVYKEIQVLQARMVLKGHKVIPALKGHREQRD